MAFHNQQFIRDQITDCRKYDPNIEGRTIVVPIPFSIEGAVL
jgi:hypothetical protein